MDKNLYIVTDPCYILSKEAWSECCEYLYGKDQENKYSLFDNAVAEKLKELSGAEAWACDTGFGDWSNELKGAGITKPKFFADAGMVCVCKLTKGIQNKLENKGCVWECGAAIFEAEGDIKVEFDINNPNWTIMKITDEGGNVFETLGEDEEGGW